MSDPLSYAAYAAAGYILRPALDLWLRARANRGKEIADRLAERRGFTARPRPPGPLIWLHAASVGESLSTLPLVAQVRSAGASVLVTSGTVTSADMIAAHLATLGDAQMFHQFAPLDVERWVARFLDHWRPDLALRVESEIWPATLTLLKRRSIPTVAVNARLSDRAARGWRRAPNLSRHVFGAFAAVAAQSDRDAEYFSALGARHVVAVGNLKFSTPPLRFDAAALSDIGRILGARPRWLAASIHPGEDTIVAAAQRTAAGQSDNPIAVVAPRHPDRAEAMAATFRGAGLSVARRSLGEEITGATQIYLADTMGELGLFYRLCPISFIGKTFAVGGGQNPIEPAQLGSAIIFGPDMSNFNDTAAALEAAGAAIRVGHPHQLGDAILHLMSSPDIRYAMAGRARALVEGQADALSRTLAIIEPYLDRQKTG